MCANGLGVSVRPQMRAGTTLNAASMLWSHSIDEAVSGRQLQQVAARSDDFTMPIAKRFAEVPGL